METDRTAREHGLATALVREILTKLREQSFSSIVAGLLCFMGMLVLVDTLRAWYRLSHVPGPFWAGFSKYWMIRQALIGRQPYANQEVNEKYGKSHYLRHHLMQTERLS
jgi:hypothetical protein